MMNRILKSVRKKMRGKFGWQITLAACLLLTLTGVGNATGTGDAAISGVTWCDINEDGERQKEEPRLPGVSVTLKQLMDDGHFQIVAAKTSNKTGAYKFPNLSLGTYIVVFGDNGQSFTAPDAVKDKRDSDVIDISGGEGATDEIYLDAVDPTNFSTDAGYLGCDTPEPPKDGVISGRAWCDENEDGRRQATEELLSGVGVTLNRVLNGQLEMVATATTDANGSYRFADLERGTYVVVFDDNGLTFTATGAGDDCTDSNADHSGSTAHIVLDAAYPTSPCIDAGYTGCVPTPDPMCAVVASTGTTFEFAYENVAPGSTVIRNGEAIDTIGGTGTFSDSPGGPDGTEYAYAIESDGQTAAVCGTVTVVNPPQPDVGVIKGKAWCDVDEDGKRQDSDTFLPEVAVTLNKQLPGGGFEVVDTTTTNANGRYRFTDLPFGTYVVAFDDNGQAFTAPDAAGDCRDSDVVEQYDGTGFTAPIVLDAHNPTSTCNDAGYVGCAEKICDLYADLWISQDYEWSRTKQILYLIKKAPGTELNSIRFDDVFNLLKTFGYAEVTVRRLGDNEIGLGTTWDYAYLVFASNHQTNYYPYPNNSELVEAVKQVELNTKVYKAGGNPWDTKDGHTCIKSHTIRHIGIQSPIALDIDGSGAVERIGGEFAFDFAANGEPVKATEWFAPSEGILVDTRIAGPMTGAHLFGDMGGQYADGYAKLATLDANADGAVSGAELTGLAIWTDANSNAMADEGEISSLAAHRIVSLSTSHTGYMSTVTLADGATMLAEDLWFPSVPVPPMAQPVAAPVPVKALALGLGGAMMLALLIAAARRRRQVSAPEAAA